MKEIKIDTEYIKLGQLLKLAGVATSGVEAKILILEGNIKVNDEVVIQRGKKLRDGDIITSQEGEYKIVKG
ncbi:MAG TPA: RNA-binding protein [Clostridiales bacterium]|nr:MAG: RNA-binding protein [Clostridiales bacterium GWD2_32_59]HAN09095.1 RNA-binding protein [Clostridiales bacterium]